jgi:hypothetical protein
MVIVAFASNAMAYDRSGDGPRQGSTDEQGAPKIPDRTLGAVTRRGTQRTVSQLTEPELAL